ncbi:MAG: twin-arginine translocase TatA/TatE family subunit [Desulfobulbaceae bacterium]|nr:twin-arginine translocase TatA/TatE family subunit [Desulfobulbaceae bacterium]
MFGLGTPELIVIMGIAFFVFGAKKLPELGSGLGKAIRSFKSEMKETEQALKSTPAELPAAEKSATVNK